MTDDLFKDFGLISCRVARPGNVPIKRFFFTAALAMGICGFTSL
jgi:hypothetical protein